MKNRSLSVELIICLILLVFLVDGALLLFLHNRQASYLYRQLQAKADEYTISLSEILSSPVWEYDDEQIRRIGEGFARNNMVTAILIQDAKGTTLFEVNGESSSNQIIRKIVIVHAGKQIGNAQFSLSLEAYQSDLKWFSNTVFTVFVVSLVLIVFAAGIVFRLLMRKPLSIFYQGMDRMTEGDYEYRFEEVRHRELADIAQRFSTMANKIREREQSLQEEATERKRAEEKIRESDNRTRAILNAIPDVLFQFDCDGRFIDMRGAPESLTLTPDQCIGRKIEQVLPDNIALIFQSQLTKTFETRRVVVFEFDFSLKNEVRNYECRLTAVSDNLALAMVRDITERVTAATERKRLLEQLQRAQKMEALGILAGGVAHDLNNVLSGLVSYPELILMDLPQESPLFKPIRTIQQSGERAANIVQDLLTLARRGVSISEVVNPNQVIRDYLRSPEHVNLLTYHPGIRIDLDLAEDLLDISGSFLHLTKTIMNLVSNGAEAAMNEGHILIKTENRYIDSPVKGYDDIEEGDYVIVEVTDYGIGIPEEDINHIFEPFYTKKKMGRSGTGLGMAVVWGTVKDHCGYIDVQSTLGKFTSVTLFLPSTKELRILESEPVTIKDLHGAGELVLVVDDIKEQREIAMIMLTKIGYNVENVSNGEAAVDFIKTRSVDLLVLDMIMDPGIDGLDTYRRIIEINPSQRAVITSGFSESDRVNEARKLGVGAYVKKPYRLETLAQAVKDVLN